MPVKAVNLGISAGGTGAVLPNWEAGRDGMLLADPADLLGAINGVRDSLYIVHDPRRGYLGAAGGRIVDRAAPSGRDTLPIIATLSGLYPEWLGDRGFAEAHGTRFPYIVGEMARGIATARMVVAAARVGFMAFFGSAGLRLPEIDTALADIAGALGPKARNWGANLIHSPNEPDLEMATVDLLLRRGVRAVSASAFMALAPPVVRFAAAGLVRGDDGAVVRRTAVFAKVSRPETAAQFMNPPPAEMLSALVEAGHISAEQAALASRLPVAEDVTVEADSGGHTDNRSLTTVLPTVLRLRDTIVAERGYNRSGRVGAAGGLGTPAAIAAAFALGAAYVLTGSINQAAVESGLSADGRAMLSKADIADVIMAPAADMFERGVRVQVLKRGTLFAQRGRRLWEIYRSRDSLEAIPADERAQLEKDIFRAPLETIWQRTRAHFETADPEQLVRAERDPRHRMALVFRWYLFMGAQWAREGIADRRADYQIWCGPAMGAFNAWTRDSFLASPANRDVVQIGLNLLEGAAVVTRAQQLRSLGVTVPASAFEFRPRPLV